MGFTRRFRRKIGTISKSGISDALKENLTIWENRKRVNCLIAFCDNVITYYGRENSENVHRSRSEINLRKLEAHRYIREAGVPFIVTHYPPPAVGGFVKEIDIITNIFDLRPHQISPENVVDVLEQAIGVYEADRKAALIRTFNPFFWLGKGLSAIGRIPFNLLENAGLHGRKLEDSTAGKVLKLLTEIVTFVSLLYGFLKLIGTDLLTLLEKFRP